MNNGIWRRKEPRQSKGSPNFVAPAIIARDAQLARVLAERGY
jgi:hypothetical protein